MHQQHPVQVCRTLCVTGQSMDKSRPKQTNKRAVAKQPLTVGLQMLSSRSAVPAHASVSSSTGSSSIRTYTASGQI
jgi:hypothetical protein